MRTLLTPRGGNFLGFAACTGMMIFALFAQYVLAMEPCPLCILQRVAVIVIGLLFLLAALHGAGRTGRRVYALLLTLVAIAGAGIAGRHVWLQNLPADQVPSCGPGLDYMLEFFPLTDAVRMGFEGSGECAKIDWMFLGLSMPAWVFIALTGLGTLAVLVNWLLAQKSET